MGHIKRAAVDWDWDDDGKASDDEEGTDITNDAADGKQYQVVYLVFHLICPGVLSSFITFF